MSKERIAGIVLVCAVLVCAASLLTGCASIASAVSGIAVASSTTSPKQAATVAEATQAATIAEQALDVYVKSGNPSKTVLQELNVLVPAVHNALVKAEQANSSGNNAATAAALATFNEALAAYESYATLQGVTH